jgi:hypothetical protein
MSFSVVFDPAKFCISLHKNTEYLKNNFTCVFQKKCSYWVGVLRTFPLSSYFTRISVLRRAFFLWPCAYFSVFARKVVNISRAFKFLRAVEMYISVHISETHISARATHILGKPPSWKSRILLHMISNSFSYVFI